MILQNQLAKTLSLEGVWEFALGLPLEWSHIQVPGCWEAQGYSKLIEGPAFYRRTVTIPAEWAGEHIFIDFTAVSYACAVRCNGTVVGEQRGLWTPFSFEITPFVYPGVENLVEVEVYKPGARYPMRSALAGFLPDVATTFGGIWQSASLRALSAGWQDVLVDPDPATGSVRVQGRLTEMGQAIGPGTLRIGVYSAERRVAFQEILLASENGQESILFDASLTVPQPELWSPEAPALYRLHLELSQANSPVAALTRRFGFRQIQTSGGLLVLNEQPVLMRGVLSWGWQPDRIAPAYTPEQAREEIRRVKALGFNLIKLCLFVPNQTYFDIADEEGVFLWEELPLWLPEVTPDLRTRAPLEYAAITRLVRDHPSVVLYSLGCELNRSVDAGLLQQLNDAVRGSMAGGLACDNSGSGESYGGLDFDFSDFTDYHPYYDLQYFEPLLDNWRRDWLPSRPWIFGEFSDSDGYRDMAELKATHRGQKPWWLTPDNPVSTWRSEALAGIEIEERLAKANLPQPESELVRIAAEQSLTARKYTLEALRRRGNLGGYVVTGLCDTPISTSGVFDDFDRPKSPSADWEMFNADTILCLDTGRRRRWINGGDRPDRLDVHNHWAGSEAVWHVVLNTFMTLDESAGQVLWKLRGPQAELLATGQGPMERRAQPGIPAGIATISCPLPVPDTACELRLEVSLEGPGLRVSNAWPIWVYPRVQWPADLGLFDPGCALDGLGALVGQACRLTCASDWTAPLVVATAWSEQLEAYLRTGGRVLLLQQGDTPLPARRGPFWREGLKLFEEHPLWQVFPHRGFAGMQFFGVASDVMLDLSRLSDFCPEIDAVRPILRRLDEREFHLTEYLFEAGLGRGRLLACSLRIQGGAGAQPSGLEHNVAGAFLLRKMIDYLLDPL